MMNQQQRESSAGSGRVVRRVFGGAAAVLLAAMLTGCPKPPPEPEPEPLPPPPPPPPAEVALGDLLQDMKADARVQFAGDVTLTDEGFARSLIELADAFARGDDEKLNKLLDAGANGQLSLLVDTGEWSDSTKPIEAVRIVYAGGYEGGAMMGGVPDVGAAMAQMMEVIKQGLAAGGGEGVFDAIAEQMAGQVTPEQIEEARNKFKEAAKLAPEEIISKVQEEMAKEMAEMPDMPAIDPAMLAGAAPSHGVLLAIQDSRGSYLLGWGASQMGDKWMFTNTPAAEGERPRASAWDGIGVMGFQYTTFSQGTVFEELFLDSPAAGGASGDAPASTPGTETPDNQREPGKKSTPSGPVNIPGGA